MSKSIDDLHPLITAGEAATMLRISKGTIHNWLSQRRLERVKVGRKTFLRRKEIESIIDGNYRAIAEASS
jgi:excisionase family DNA binding protein